MKGPLPPDVVEMMAEPHLAALDRLGISVQVTWDLGDFLRVMEIANRLPSSRPAKLSEVIRHPAFDPEFWPDAGPADTFIVVCQDRAGQDVGIACGRVLDVGPSLPADIVSGRLFYGRETPACRFAWVSRLQVPEVANCKVGVAGGVWTHPEIPARENGINPLFSPMWRLLLTSMLAVEWTWLLGVQKVWNLSRHGWEPQGFTSAIRGLTWGDDPTRLTLSLMHAAEAIDGVREAS